MTGRNSKPRKALQTAILGLLPLTGPAISGEAGILDVETNCNSQRICSFAVTVKHADTGWDHYVDRWDVIVPDDEIIGTRVLHHPHVEEQPFTRRLADVRIPGNTRNIIIRVHDSVHGYGKHPYPVTIP